MKKLALAAALSVASTTAFAGGIAPVTPVEPVAVSYTHLTLPTIYSV